jgi:acetyl esterase/lipase
LLLASCDDSNDEEKTDASKALIMKDVSYGPDAYNILDLSLPAGRTSQTPIVVFIHGGGWREGSKEQYTSIIGDFVAQGFATATINYRPANADAKISYIQLLEDIDKALAYLQDNEGKNIYNGSNVHLFGHSAGAHLALLYAYRNNTRGQVKSVISLSAPTDLEDLLEKDVFPTLLYNLVGSDDLDKFKDASPITHATPSSVPTFFIHGKADESVPYRQSEMLFQQLSEWNRMSNRLELIDNAGHDFSEAMQEAIVDESIAYLKLKN